MRSREGRRDFQRYYESAIVVPGPITDIIGETAKTWNMLLVIGVIESDRGTLYCTALMFSRHGRLLGTHRKLMPTAMERLVWG